jgi:uncharacterized membrane protein
MFAIADSESLKKSFVMDDKRGRWVGVAVSGLFIGLISFVGFVAVSGIPIVGAFFNEICHQVPDRCYHIHGIALPVCVRCIWIYLGLATGHILFIYWKPETVRITRALIGVITLMILDVLLEKLGLYENWFWSRAVTGSLFGLIVSHFTLLGLRELYCEFTNPFTYVRSKFFSGRTH